MVAAYFACIGDWGMDGAIWWISSTAIEASLHGYWEERGFELMQSGSVDPEKGFFKPNAYELVTMWGLTLSFDRAQKQHGLFTIGTRYGIDHDVVLKKQVPEGQYGRITIPAKLKESVLRYLNQEGIDAVSLLHACADQVADADQVGLTMARHLKEKRGTSTASILPPVPKAHNS
jgi:hypothetical protein